MRHRLTAHSQEQAERLLEEKLAERREPVFALTGDVRLEEYARSWLAGHEVKPRTLESYEQLLRVHIYPVFGDFKLREVTTGHIRQLLTHKRAREGLSKNTVRLVRAVLNLVYVAALADGCVKENPLARLPKTKREARSEVIRPLSHEELARFLEAANNDRPKSRRHEVLYGSENFVLFLLLARSGLRPGEAFALRWEDFDFSRREILVERTLSVSGQVGTTKTGRARRVDMSRELASTLAALYKHREEQTLKNRWGQLPQCVFINRAGQPLDINRVRKQFMRIARQAGLSGHKLYDLRHTYATLLLAEGTPITYVAAQLGHAKPTTTLRWYAHWLPRSDKSFVDALDSQGLAPTLAPKLEIEALRSQKPFDSIGGADADRTRDLLNAIQALSQTELQPHRAES